MISINEIQKMPSLERSRSLKTKDWVVDQQRHEHHFGSWLEIPNLRPLPRPKDLRFTKILRWFIHTLKFEKDPLRWPVKRSPFVQILFYPSSYLTYDCRGWMTSEAVFCCCFCFSSERERNGGHGESVEGKRETLLEVLALWEFILSALCPSLPSCCNLLQS